MGQVSREHIGRRQRYAKTLDRRLDHHPGTVEHRPPDRRRRETGGGDKTGNNGKDTTNDVAITWPPGRGPILLAVFHDRGGDEGARNTVHAEVARAVVKAGLGA
ncbi:hypothetical protein [Caulobacter sp. BP25]|uniref:hypothetical protein n=1 Tax=Caulobacter sp. BP25 TaxID=2048900 RepID=UPI001F2BFF43|nr:hypothetical protein [Caulobacter sp. BP25]